MSDIRILYIDDEEKWLNAVEQVLQLNGFNVDTATDVDEALQKMTGNQYDMVLLDVRLKGRNGWEFVRGVKQINPEVAIVLYTSDYEVEKLTDIFGIGVEDYLEKSSDILSLANRLKALYFRFIKRKNQVESYQITPKVFFKVSSGILIINDEEHYLKSNESCLLALLCRKMGEVISVEELYDGVWGKATLFDSKDKALRNLVSELRKYLTGTDVEIRNRRFGGYFLRNR